MFLTVLKSFKKSGFRKVFLQYLTQNVFLKFVTVILTVVT